MISEVNFILFCLITINVLTVKSNVSLDPGSTAFDENFYTDQLDPEQCERQLSYINNDSTLQLSFLEAGLRFPRGISQGNFKDMGNYHQCINIDEPFEDSNIIGKYCYLSVVINNLDFYVPNTPEFTNWLELKSQLNNDFIDKYNKYAKYQNKTQHLLDVFNRDTRSLPSLSGITLNLAVCVPKTCTSEEGVNGLLFDLNQIGVQYSENFCRLKNDKPWTPSDTVATAIFSVLGLVTIASTCYDIWHTFFKDGEEEEGNKILKMFSVYTNTKSLLTFKENPNDIHCVNGVRSLGMLWIVLAHVFSVRLSFGPVLNFYDALEWNASAEALWVKCANMSVDTFFFLSGLLVTYTTFGKLNGWNLLKSLHLFYLNRWLRMMPLLMTVILLQSSFFHRIVDGPLWQAVADNTNNCRTFWWSHMLFIHNYINPSVQCIGHLWYLAVDFQLHIISPIVLFWLVKDKWKSWVALCAGLLVSLLTGALLNFLLADREEYNHFQHYYFNTLTRASPFFVGMVFGYLLAIYKGKRLRIPKVTVAVGWVLAVGIAGLMIYSYHPTTSGNILKLFNSFHRPLWALSLGWLVLACVHGYSGPVNWFLSWHMWRVFSRISYAVFVFHFALQYVENATEIYPFYFSMSSMIFKFLADLMLAILVAFIGTILVDMPFVVLTKLLMDKLSPKRNPKPGAVK